MKPSSKCFAKTASPAQRSCAASAAMAAPASITRTSFYASPRICRSSSKSSSPPSASNKFSPASTKWLTAASSPSKKSASSSTVPPRNRRNMQNSAPKQSWLNRTVLGVGLTSLFSDWSHETATAVLPAFLAAIGAGPAWLGAIEGIADGLSSFAKLAAGHFTDRLKRRKPLAVFGYAFTALATASFAFATHAYHVLFGRAAAWLGRDRKSTRLNSSHMSISYAVFCLKKKKQMK